VAISFGASEQKKGVVPSIPTSNFHLVPTNMPVLNSQWQQPTLQSIGPGVTLGGIQNGREAVEKDESPEGEFERAVTKTSGWLEKRKRADVENLVSLRNTDLRAGDDWLVFISPAVKKRLARRMW
jgi:hypothetical protein